MKNRDGCALFRRCSIRGATGAQQPCFGTTTPPTHGCFAPVAPLSCVLSTKRKCLGFSVIAMVGVLLVLAGCATREEASTVHPHLAGRPFQECPVDLTGYKSVQTRAGQDASLGVAVAISGGGHRAGNFAVGVMLALEELTGGPSAVSNALMEIDYLSTVSGGGLAAATYVGSLHDHLTFGGMHGDYRLAGVLSAAHDPNEPTAGRTDQTLRRHLQVGYIDDIV